MIAGDLNGDGNDDLIFSVTGRDSGSDLDVGSVYVVYGPASGNFDATNVDVVIDGGAAGDSFGAALHAADVDGDGSDDLVIGAPRVDGSNTDIGAVFLFFGPLGSSNLTTTDADVTITGTDTEEYFGQAVLLAEVDGDTNLDLVVSAPSASSDGSVHVFSDAATLGASLDTSDATFTASDSSSAQVGFAVAASNDWLFASAPGGASGAGSVYAVPKSSISGASSIDLDTSSAVVRVDGSSGAGLGEHIEVGMTSGGSGDYEYIAMSAGAAADVFLFETSSLSPYTSVANPDCAFDADEGHSVDGRKSVAFGDIDGDGSGDVVVTDTVSTRSGSTSWSDGAGYLFYGDSLACAGGTSYSMSTADEVFYNSASSGLFGFGLAIGNFNEDSKEDILFGDPATHGGAGRGWMFYGPFDPIYDIASLADADTIFEGDSSLDRGGYAVSGVGDMNCDGVGDLAVSAIMADDGSDPTGAVYVFFGPTPGSEPLQWQNVDLALTEADAEFWGEDADDLFGYRVSDAGDVDGDGCDDLLVGAPQAETSTSGTDAGVAYLFYGSSSLSGGYSAASDAGASFVGTDGLVSGSELGSAVAGLGDLDGDGYDDIGLGAPMYDSSSGTPGTEGHMSIFFGGAGGSALSGEYDIADEDCGMTGQALSDDELGTSLAGGVDFDADGNLDIAVGAPGDSTSGYTRNGVINILSGPGSCSGAISSADLVIGGDLDSAGLGWSLAAAGDVDDDGYDDFVAGAPDYNAGRGRAYWLPGQTTTGTVTAPASGVKICYSPDSQPFLLGWSVDGNSDVDMDGLPDIVVGAPHKNESGQKRGDAYLFASGDLTDAKGWSTCLDPSAAIFTGGGEAWYDYAGWRVSLVGDLNQDGEGDLLIGAYGSDRGGNLGGAAYVILSSY